MYIPQLQTTLSVVDDKTYYTQFYVYVVDITFTYLSFVCQPLHPPSQSTPTHTPTPKQSTPPHTHSLHSHTHSLSLSHTHTQSTPTHIGPGPIFECVRFSTLGRSPLLQHYMVRHGLIEVNAPPGPTISRRQVKEVPRPSVGYKDLLKKSKESSERHYAEYEKWVHIFVCTKLTNVRVYVDNSAVLVCVCVHSVYSCYSTSSW